MCAVYTQSDGWSLECDATWKSAARNKKKPVGLKFSPLKDVILGSSPSVNRKLLTHILTNVLTHTQTSELGNYNKLSLWLSLKRQM